jgi:hypothetical protein
MTSQAAHLTETESECKQSLDQLIRDSPFMT